MAPVVVSYLYEHTNPNPNLTLRDKSTSTRQAACLPTVVSSYSRLRDGLLGVGERPVDVYQYLIAPSDALGCVERPQVEAKDYDLASSLERELASFLRKNGMDFEDDGK